MRGKLSVVVVVLVVVVVVVACVVLVELLVEVEVVVGTGVLPPLPWLQPLINSSRPNGIMSRIGKSLFFIYQASIIGKSLL